jgi:hypothetical protein
MTNDELKNNLMDLIQAAVDLANSVRDDVQEMRHISDETILLLSDFRRKHDEIDNLLDVLNGIN